MEDLNVIRLNSPSSSGVVKAQEARVSTPKVGENESKGTAPIKTIADNIALVGQAQPAVSKAEVKAAVSSLNLELEKVNRSLRFEIDDSTEELIVFVLDDEGEVIRQVPPEVSVRLAANRDLSGLFANVQG